MGAFRIICNIWFSIGLFGRDTRPCVSTDVVMHTLKLKIGQPTLGNGITKTGNKATDIR